MEKAAITEVGAPAEQHAAPTDPRFDSFAEAGLYGRLRILERAVLSSLALVGFLLIPGIKLKARYALAIARLPLFRAFAFFRVMHRLVDEAAQQQRRSS